MLNAKTITAAIVVIVVLVVAGSAPYTLGQSQQGLVLEFGHVKRIENTPGLHFKVPFVEQVHRFSARVLTFNASPQSFTTKDGDNVTVDYFVKWRVKDVRLFYQATGGSLAHVRNRLSRIADAELRQQISQRSLTALVSQDHGGMAAAVLKSLQSKISHMGVQIIDMHVRRINLPDSVTKSIYEKMKSAQQKQAKQLRAEGAEQAETIKAQAERQRSDILADAYRQAEEIRGEGDAEAASIFAQAYAKNPKFYRFYRSMQIYREGWKSKQDRLVLAPDSPLFDYFHGPSGKH